MNDTSGHPSGKPFAYYDRGSRFLKMYLDIDRSGLTTFFGTVPKTGTMSGGRLYALPTSEHPMGGSDSSSPLLPTPMARDAKGISFSLSDQSRLINVAVSRFSPYWDATTQYRGGSTSPPSDAGNGSPDDQLRTPPSPTNSDDHGSPQSSTSG